MGFIKEFKEFISRGNVLDMAIGVVIGGSFSAIVNSLVDDVIMPVVGKLTAGVDFKSLSIPLGGVNPETGETVAINIGLFLNSVITFLIIAFVIFLVVKGINKLRERSKKVEEEEAAPAGPTEVELLQELLAEIKRANKTVDSDTAESDKK